MKTFLAHTWLVVLAVYMKTQWRRIVRGALRENFYFMGFKHRIHVSDAPTALYVDDRDEAKDCALMIYTSVAFQVSFSHQIF